MAAPTTSSTQGNLGGWKTFPFVIGGTMGITITEFGVMANFVVYLIQQYNLKSVEATQISNFFHGCIAILPVLGAILADASCGCFAVAALGSVACLLGTFLLALTSIVANLRPPPCTLSPCQGATTAQLSVLYLAIAFIGIGTAGTRYNLATLGANQFDDPTQQATFFNWYFALGIYVSSIIGQIGIVYIDDNVGWQWSYIFCVILLAASFAVLLVGKRYYRLDISHKRSPFLGLIDVVVSALWERKGHHISDGYQRHDCKLENGEKPLLACLSESHSLEGENNIRDFKVILHVLPIVASVLPVSTSIALLMNFSLLQALAMDRHITSHFILPAGSINVIIVLTVSISIMFLDRVVYPIWRCIAGQSPSPLKRIGIANALVIATIACAAFIEKMRLETLQTTQDDTKAPVLWLIPPLIMIGLVEALHVPGLVSFYHQEFPETLRSMATGMFALTTGAGFYITMGVLKVLRSFTGWLRDDVDHSRIDNIYWMLTVILFVNLVYYIVCARLYKHWNVQGQ